MARNGRGARGRGAALLLGCALLVVAFVVWFAGTGPSDAAVRPEAVTPAAAAREGAELRGPDAPPDADADARLEVAMPASVAEGDRASELAGVEPPLESGVPIRVLRGRTDEPVAHALVTVGEYWDDRDATALELEARGSAVVERLQNVKRYEADEQGLVLLPWSSTYCYAFAGSGDLWGWLEFLAEPRYEPLELRLVPDADVVVLVVTDAERAPVAGAEVALRYAMSPDDVSTLDTRTTDASGIARFEHIRQHTSYYWAHTEQILVELAGVFGERNAVAFDPENVPERIELVLPVCTALDVTVLDADGRLAAEPILVTVGVTVGRAENGEDGPEDSVDSVARVAHDGRVAFEQIGPGLDVSVVGRGWNGRGTPAVETRTAPNAGGRIPVTLQLGSPPPAITGRLVLPDGSPAAELDVIGMLSLLSRRTLVSARTRTDADGSFRLGLGILTLEDRFGLTLKPAGEPSGLSFATELRGPIIGDHALGEIALQADPPLAAGRVADDRGNPIEAAGVNVVGTDVLGRPDTMLASARTAADGTFSTFGRTGGAEVRLDARHRLYGDGEHPLVVPGARDVTLVLPSAGGIRGNVLLDSEWLCDFVVAEARFEGDEEWSETAWLERPGAFAFEGLKPGPWTVHVGMEGEYEQGVTIADVQVAAGAMTRLADVDLRGKAGVRSFRIVDEDGEPIADGEVSHRAPDEVEWSGSVSIENGLAHVFTVLPEVDLFVQAPDHLSAFVPRAREDRDIVLPAGIPVHFHCAEPLNQGDRFVLVGLGGSEVGMPMSTLTPDLRADVDQVTLMPHAGDFDVRWRGYRSGDRSPRFSNAEPQTISVRHSSEPQDVEIVPPPEILAFLKGDG